MSNYNRYNPGGYNKRKYEDYGDGSLVKIFYSIKSIRLYILK
jgi:hypothetical protein